jgi:hypothetical protein
MFNIKYASIQFEVSDMNVPCFSSYNGTGDLLNLQYLNVTEVYILLRVQINLSFQMKFI